MGYPPKPIVLSGNTKIIEACGGGWLRCEADGTLLLYVEHAASVILIAQCRQCKTQYRIVIGVDVILDELAN